MRALALTQPWTGLVASGIKAIENRDRPIIKSEDFGQRFALHASKKANPSVYHRIDQLWPRCRFTWESIIDGRPRHCVRRVGHSSPCDDLVDGDATWLRLSRITGAIIATAVIHDALYIGGCSRAHIEKVCADRGMPEQARWMFGPTCYLLRDVRVLDTPVPCRGYQSFWHLDSAVADRVTAQLPRAA